MMLDVRERSRRQAISSDFSTARTTSSGPQRLYWADAAKAIAVILVVLYHVAPVAVGWLVDGQSRGEELISSFSRALLPVRMPLFFMVSGLLATRALARPWRSVAQKRILNLIWVFVLWTILYAFPYAASSAGSDYASTLNRALLWTVNLSGAYWFLPMLVLMFAAVKLTRRIHPSIILAAALVLRLFASYLPVVDDPFLADVRMTAFRFATFFFWYCLGALAHALLPKAVGLATWVWPLLLPVFAALTLHNVSDANTVDWTLLLSIIGILGILGVSELVTRVEIGRRLARYVATRTLPIYIFHALLIVLLKVSNLRLPELTSLQSALLVTGMTFGLTWMSCLLWDILEPRLPLLFRAPPIIKASTGAPNGAPRR